MNKIKAHNSDIATDAQQWLVDDSSNTHSIYCKCWKVMKQGHTQT